MQGYPVPEHVVRRTYYELLNKNDIPAPPAAPPHMIKGKRRTMLVGEENKKGCMRVKLCNRIRNKIVPECRRKYRTGKKKCAPTILPQIIERKATMNSWSDEIVPPDELQPNGERKQCAKMYVRNIVCVCVCDLFDVLNANVKGASNASNALY